MKVPNVGDQDDDTEAELAALKDRYRRVSSGSLRLGCEVLPTSTMELRARRGSADNLRDYRELDELKEKWRRLSGSGTGSEVGMGSFGNRLMAAGDDVLRHASAVVAEHLSKLPDGGEASRFLANTRTATTPPGTAVLGVDWGGQSPSPPQEQNAPCDDVSPPASPVRPPELEEEEEEVEEVEEVEEDEETDGAAPLPAEREGSRESGENNQSNPLPSRQLSSFSSCGNLQRRVSFKEGVAPPSRADHKMVARARATFQLASVGEKAAQVQRTAEDEDARRARVQHLLRAHDEYETALKDGVVMDASEDGVRGLGMDKQADLTMLGPQRLAERQRLRYSPTVQAAVDRWWDRMPKHPITGNIDQPRYAWLSRKLFRALRPSGTEKEFQSVLATDWEIDSMGKADLDKGRFNAAIFHFADIWCPTLGAKEYADYLDGIARDHIFTSDHQFGESEQLLAGADGRTDGTHCSLCAKPYALFDRETHCSACGASCCGSCAVSESRGFRRCRACAALAAERTDAARPLTPQAANARRAQIAREMLQQAIKEGRRQSDDEPPSSTRRRRSSVQSPSRRRQSGAADLSPEPRRGSISSPRRRSSAASKSPRSLRGSVSNTPVHRTAVDAEKVTSPKSEPEECFANVAWIPSGLGPEQKEEPDAAVSCESCGVALPMPLPLFCQGCGECLKDLVVDTNKQRAVSSTQLHVEGGATAASVRRVSAILTEQRRSGASPGAQAVSPSPPPPRDAATKSPRPPSAPPTRAGSALRQQSRGSVSPPPRAAGTGLAAVRGQRPSSANAATRSGVSESGRRQSHRGGSGRRGTGAK